MRTVVLKGGPKDGHEMTIPEAIRSLPASMSTQGTWTEAPRPVRPCGRYELTDLTDAHGRDVMQFREG